MGRAHGHSLDLQGVDGGRCDGGEHVDLFDQPLQHAVAVDLIQTQLVVPAASPSANTSTDADHKGLIGTLISLKDSRARELCESRGGRPGLPVPDSHYGLYGRKTKLNIVCLSELRGCVKVKVTIPGSPSLPVFMVGLYGHKATLNILCFSELRGCVKVEVTILGSLSLVVYMVSVDVKQC